MASIGRSLFLGVELGLENFSDVSDVDLVADDVADAVVSSRRRSNPERVPESPQVSLDAGDAIS